MYQEFVVISCVTQALGTANDIINFTLIGKDPVLVLNNNKR